MYSTLHAVTISALFRAYMHAGISGLISDHPEVPSVVDYTDEDEETKTACNKDTGSRKKLQKWTRGHLFIVRGGGHIETWQPLYQ